MSASTPTDLVRVLRIVEYTGSRAVVEECVARSIHGEKRPYGPASAFVIRAATIGEYPEILTRSASKEPGRREGHFLIIGKLTGKAIGCLSNPTLDDMAHAQQEDPGATFREVDAEACEVCGSFEAPGPEAGNKIKVAGDKG